MERLGDPERLRLAERAVVGDMMGHLFTRDGTIVEDLSSDRTIAAPLEVARANGAPDPPHPRIDRHPGTPGPLDARVTSPRRPSRSTLTPMSGSR